jgi:hypothetical protein
MVQYSKLWHELLEVAEALGIITLGLVILLILVVAATFVVRFLFVSWPHLVASRHHGRLKNSKEKWPKQGPGQVEGNSKCQRIVCATVLTSAQEEFFQIRQEHLAIGGTVYFEEEPGRRSAAKLLTKD